jgi:hypothetical protein
MGHGALGSAEGVAPGAGQDGQLTKPSTITRQISSCSGPDAITSHAPEVISQVDIRSLLVNIAVDGNLSDLQMAESTSDDTF